MISLCTWAPSRCSATSPATAASRRRPRPTTSRSRPSARSCRSSKGAWTCSSIDRSTRPLQLTPLGQTYYEGCKTLLEQYAELEASHPLAPSAKSPARCRWRPSTPSASATWASTSSASQPSSPSAQVHIEYLHPDRVYEQVLDGHGRPRPGVVPAQVAQAGRRCPGARRRWCWPARPRHPLARAAWRCQPRELAGQKYVHFDQQPGRFAARWIASCASRTSAVDVVLEFDNIENIKQAVAIGAGVALLARADPAPRGASAAPWSPCRCSAAGSTRPLGIIHRRRHSAERRGPSASSNLLRRDAGVATRPPRNGDGADAHRGATAAQRPRQPIAAPARAATGIADRGYESRTLIMQHSPTRPAGPLRPRVRARRLRRRLRRRPEEPQVARHRRARRCRSCCNLEHRGACGCETNTGDGAGILMQMPHRFLRQECDRLGITLPAAGRLRRRHGLPAAPTPHDRAALRGAVRADRPRGRPERPRLARPCRPTTRIIGPTAQSRRAGHAPDLHRPKDRGVPADRHDDPLGLRAQALRHPQAASRTPCATRTSPQQDMFYVPSLSCKTLIYKGMLNADAARRRTSPTCATRPSRSALALVHSRFSTNTFPNWAARPSRTATSAHNGEINTLRGNINWMHARESMFAVRAVRRRHQEDPADHRRDAAATRPCSTTPWSCSC